MPIQDTSFYKPYLFLLPLTIILTVGIKIQSLQDSILKTGTYISVYIESKDDDLNWETNLKQRRINSEEKLKWSRQLPNYLPFLLLGLVCVVASILSWIPLETSLDALIDTLFFILSNITLSTIILFAFWILSVFALVIWSYKMRDSFRGVTQQKYEDEILEALKTKEKESEN